MKRRAIYPWACAIGLLTTGYTSQPADVTSSKKSVGGDAVSTTYTFTAGDVQNYVYNAGPESPDTVLTYGNDEIALSASKQVDNNAATFSAGTFVNTLYDAGSGVVRLTMQAGGAPMLLYAGGENNDPIPSLSNAADAALGAAHVGGGCCGLAHMETGRRDAEQVPAVGGAGYFAFAGSAHGKAPTYASNTLLQLGAYQLLMANGSYLEYEIYPESQGSTNSGSGATDSLSLYVTLNVIFSDGSDAISGGATDASGRSLDPPVQYASLELDAWNRVFVDLSAFAGKQVDRIDVNFHNDGANGGFRGYIDEINLVGQATNHPTNISALDANWTPQYDHLMGYWNFDGTGSVAQDVVIPGVVGADLAAQNGDGLGLTYVDGQVGQGILLDGSDDYFRLPYDFAANSHALTFSAWHYFSGNPAECQVLFSFMNTPQSFYSFTESCNGQSSYTSKKSNSDQTALEAAPLPSNAWSHIVTTFVDHTATIYVNGLVWASSIDMAHAPADIPSDFRTLGLNIGPTGTVSFLRGRLDEVAFWDVALTAKEVQRIYERQRSAVSGTFTSRVFDANVPNAPWTGMGWTTPEPFGKPLPDGMSETAASYSSVAENLEDKLQVLWHLEETALGTAPGGTDCRDASGAGNHGIYVGALGSDFVLGQPGVTGDSNGVVLSDTTPRSGYVVTPASLPDSAPDFAYQVWFKTNTDVGGKIIGFGNSNTGYSSNVDRPVYMIDSGAIVYGRDAGAAAALTTPASYNDGRWHHLLVSQQGAMGYLYIDAALIGTLPGAPQAYTPRYLKVGCDYLGLGPSSGPTCFSGEVDEVAYWARALSSTEALQLYRRGANRLGLQVRSCAQPDCSDGPSWQGPDGTATTWFSEAQHSDGAKALTTSPDVTFATDGHADAVRPAQYFQYRALFDSDDRNSMCISDDASPLGCTAELSRVAIAPTRYSRRAPTFTVIGPLPAFSHLKGLTETYGAEGCAGKVGYRLSLDGVHWYYYADGAWQWAQEESGRFNPSSDLDSASLAQFSREVGKGRLHLQGALQSDGAHPCALGAVILSYLP